MDAHGRTPHMRGGGRECRNTTETPAIFDNRMGWQLYANVIWLESPAG